MARGRRKAPSPTNNGRNDNGAKVGYEAQLWQMADALRGSMDAAEYKHVVLGLIFLNPRCVVKLLEPYRGRVYEPCCGSSGMFVQSIEFIRAHASGNSSGNIRLFEDKIRASRVL
jgi:type I restriction-modification system DNA methylase subunit